MSDTTTSDTLRALWAVIPEDAAPEFDAVSRKFVDHLSRIAALEAEAETTLKHYHEVVAKVFALEGENTRLRSRLASAAQKFQCCKCGEWKADVVSDHHRPGGAEDWCKDCMGDSDDE